MANTSRASAGARDEKAMVVHMTVIEEREGILRNLLQHGASPNARAKVSDLFIDFPTDAEHQEYLMPKATKVKKSKETEIEIIKTTTPLHVAARHSSANIARILLEFNAEVDARMEGGETPLMIAVLLKRIETVKLLIEKGADVNAATLWGKTPLHYASRIGDIDIVKLLLDKGARVDG